LGVVQAQEDDGDEALEEVVVTGSRIARDEYTSAAPLQAFDIQSARQIGVASISELLQRSTIANGQQLNGELNTNAGNSNASESSAIGGDATFSIAGVAARSASRGVLATSFDDPRSASSRQRMRSPTEPIIAQRAIASSFSASAGMAVNTAIAQPIR